MSAISFSTVNVAKLIVSFYVLLIILSSISDINILYGALMGSIIGILIPFSKSTRVEKASIASILKRFSVALAMMALGVIGILFDFTDSMFWVFSGMGISLAILVKTEIL